MSLESFKKVVSIVNRAIVSTYSLNFEISLVDLRLTSVIKRHLNDLGATGLRSEDNGYQFKIDTQDLLSKPRLGAAVVSVTHSNSAAKVSIYFRSKRIFNMLFLALAILFVIVSTNCHQGKDIASSLAMIFGFIAIGYIQARISIGSENRNIQKFFIKIGK